MEKINLSEYCPSSKSQYRATCYSYAVVYTALSIEFNIKNNVTDKDQVNLNHFSPGVVASNHNSSLPLLKRSLYCGRNGTASKSLEILKNTGTIKSSDYDCDCKVFKKIKRKISENTIWYKISGYKSLEINNKHSENNLNWILNTLQEKHPVIIGLYQNTFFKNIKSEFIDNEQIDNNTQNILNNAQNGKSNHVVCIIGYDLNYKNGKGYFLVKNNYINWGSNNGFSWIPFTFLIPLIHKSYCIEEIVY